MRLFIGSLLLAAGHALGEGWTYSAEIVSKAPTPALSIANPIGQGYSPCMFTFNPAFIPAGPGLDRSIAVVRVSECPEEYGGAENHLMFANCDFDGTCGDLETDVYPFEDSAEDPRIFFYDGYYWMYYYANGKGSNNDRSVYLRKSKTPADVNSWELVTARLNWHRNGCTIIRDDGLHYVVYGESGPLPAIGIAQTRDFKYYNYVNETFYYMNGEDDVNAPEVVIEAATAPIQLTTGDYFHLYAAGTPGWVPDGNYTGGWIVMDQKDPTIILQRSEYHLFIPTMDYEIGDGIWPVQRNRTIFTTSIHPLGGDAEKGGQMFRVWYGAADANVATADIIVFAKRA